MDSALAFLQSQWSMIAEAPLPFIVGWLIFGGVAWAMARHQFSERLATAEERIRFKDDQIAAYKDKLQGATPDEAAGRIAALEARLQKLGPRSITADQSRAMRSALLGTTGHLALRVDVSVADATILAASLKSPFEEAGWIVPWPPRPTTVHTNPPPTGLAVVVEADNQLPLVVLAALDAAEIAYDLRASQSLSTQGSVTILVSHPQV